MTPFTSAATAELLVVIAIFIIAAIAANFEAIFYALGALGR